MANIITVNGKTPQIHPTAWVAENATITGDVVIGAHASIWFQTVIRGDVNKIIIGDRVNVQDGSMVHGTIGRGDTILEENVSIGHRAVIHGCHIKSNVLVGMGAIVLDDAILASGTIIGAGAVVTQGTQTESGWIYGGIPAKKIKPLDPGQAELYLKGTADHYVMYKDWYK